MRTSNGYREVNLHEFTASYDGQSGSGVHLDGDYLLGETYFANLPAYENGSVYALKFASALRSSRSRREDVTIGEAESRAP